MSDAETYKTDCRLFTGFSPCRYRRSCVDCPHYDPVETRILLIQLGALGDVLRTTSLLPALFRAYPRAHVTWLCSSEAAPLLAHNPLVQRVLKLGEATAAILDSLEFDLALCPDKSIPACSVMNLVRCPDRRGFSVNSAGAIVPLGEASAELYALGLDNERKFFKNTKTEQQLVSEALGLEYARDRYVVVLTDQERRWALEDRRVAGVGTKEILVGWNTGCNLRYPYKRFTVPDQVQLMVQSWKLLSRRDRIRFALLGGGEDTERNREIATLLREARIPASCTPTDQGIRRGFSAVAGCDMVVTGDTLGLHMAIGLKKPTVVWFGITCHQEIDLFGRGIKVLSNVRCRPCWLQSCELERKCYREMPWDRLALAIAEMASTLLRDGNWTGEQLIGQFPAEKRITPPIGVSPGPIL